MSGIKDDSRKEIEANEAAEILDAKNCYGYERKKRKKIKLKRLDAVRMRKIGKLLCQERNVFSRGSSGAIKARIEKEGYVLNNQS